MEVMARWHFTKADFSIKKNPLHKTFQTKEEKRKINENTFMLTVHHVNIKMIFVFNN